MCGTPDEIELTAMGVELNCSRRVPQGLEEGLGSLATDVAVVPGGGRYNNPWAAVNSIPFGPPHVCPMRGTCGA